MLQQKCQIVVNGRQIDEMVIVQHKDEMLFLRSYLVDRRNKQRSNRRRLRSCQRLDHCGAAGVDGTVHCQRYIAPEVDRVVVVFVECQPRQRRRSALMQRAGRLQHRCCFAKTCRGADKRQWYIDEITQLCKDASTWNEMAAIGGWGNPGNEQRFAHETPIASIFLVVLYRNSV
jgi:carbamoylphosphate synthase large subunit